MVDGFLGRWSQRKQAVKQGREVDEPQTAEPPRVEARVQAVPLTVTGQSAEGNGEGAQHESGNIQARPSLPTLDDVKALNHDSSFAPFVSRDVTSEVRNAAMKKLFTDPHYNVMDGLDIYIDDYSQPDPMPAAMLRQLASAKYLNLFDDEEVPASAMNPASESLEENGNTVAQTSTPAGEPVPALSEVPVSNIADIPSAPLTADPYAQQSQHDHNTDLRLQPNHASGRTQSERISE